MEKHFNKVLYLLLLLTVITLPLALSTLTLGSTIIKGSVLGFLVISIFFVWFLKILFSNSLSFRQSSLNIPIITFIGICIVSLCLSNYKAVSVERLWKVLISCSLYFIAFNHVRNKDHLKILLNSIVIVAGIVAIYGILQYFDLGYIIWVKNPQNRIYSSMGNPNFLAGYIIMTIPITLSLFLCSKRPSFKYIFGLIIFLLFTCLILTGSKGAIISLIFGCLLFILLLIKKRPLQDNPNTKRTKVLYLFIICILIGTSFFKFGKPLISSIKNTKTSIGVRSIIWDGAWKIFKANPIIGSGIGTFQIYFPEYRNPSYNTNGMPHITIHAHNEYLQTLSEMGLIGFFSFLWIFIVYFKKMLLYLKEVQDKHQKIIIIGLLSGTIVILIHGFVSVTLRWYTCSAYLWLFLGLSIITAKGPNINPAPIKLSFNIYWKVLLTILSTLLFSITFIFLIYNPFVSEVFLRKAVVEMRKGHFEKAINKYGQSIKFNPNHYRAYYKMAWCYLEWKKLNESLKTYLTLQKINPNYGQIHFNLGYVYGLLRDWSNSSREFDIAKKLQSNLAGIDFEGIKENAGEEEKEFHLLKATVKANPEDKSARNKLGLYYREKKNLAQSAFYFSEAIKIDPDYVPALNNLAGIYYAQNKFDKVIEMCNRIIEIDEEAFQTRINLGRVYIKTERTKEALKEWNKVLELDPENKAALNCINHYKK